MGLEIGFAHQSFKWTNNAKNKEGVLCAIINLRKTSNTEKYLFKEEKIQLKNINSVNGEKNVIIKKTNESISDFPKMVEEMYHDNEHVILDNEEKEKLLSNDNRSKKFIKKLVGADEFINGMQRYCLWIRDDQLEF